MSRNKKILVLFDFCETLVDFQTADDFLNKLFIENRNLFGISVEIFRKLINKLHLCSGAFNKKMHLYKLKNLNYHLVQSYSEIYLKKKLIPSIVSYSIDRLKWHKEQGHFIVIISGGYSIYLELFGNCFDVNEVIGTDIQVVNNRLTGLIDGIDCMGLNKIKKLAKKIDLNDFDLESSYCYTDSLSDLPILSLVANRFILNPNCDIDICNSLSIKIISEFNSNV